MKKHNEDTNKDDHKLRNFSEVSSFNRLIEPDVEPESKLIAGGDEHTFDDSSDNSPSNSKSWYACKIFYGGDDMPDKSKNSPRNIIEDFGKIFISKPEIAKTIDDIDTGDLEITPFRELLKDNYIDISSVDELFDDNKKE